MSADRQALLAALRDEPDDATLRLVYADWLEDNGDPDRAELIRVCHELAPLDEDDPQARRLERRRAQLWRRHRNRWAAGIPATVAKALRGGGLAQRVESSAAVFLKCGEALKGEPVARVRLRDVAKHLGKVLASPLLDGVPELVLADSVLDDAAVRHLAGSPRLGGLRTLRLLSCAVNADRAAILAGSPHLANLRTLDLEQYDRRDDEVNNTVWRNVGGSRVMRSLNRPGQVNQLGDGGIAALAASPHLAGLERLYVAHNWITPAGARHLWARGRFKNLRRLDLSYNYLGPRGLRELVNSPLARRLTHLEVHGNEVGDEGVRALAGAANARGLKLLDISGSPLYDDRPVLTNASAQALADSPHLAGLEHLVLTFTDIGPKGAAALARSARLPSLRSLYLGSSPVGDRGAKALASSDLLGRLAHLGLNAAGITPVGAMAFVRSKKAGEQLTLDLSDNPVDADAVAALRERFGRRVLIGSSAE